LDAFSALSEYCTRLPESEGYALAADIFLPSSPDFFGLHGLDDLRTSLDFMILEAFSSL